MKTPLTAKRKYYKKYSMTRKEICEHILYYGRCSNCSCGGEYEWSRNYGMACPLSLKKYLCTKGMLEQAQRWLDDHGHV